MSGLVDASLTAPQETGGQLRRVGPGASQDRRLAVQIGGVTAWRQGVAALDTAAALSLVEGAGSGILLDDL